MTPLTFKLLVYNVDNLTFKTLVYNVDNLTF